jgi:hypothetical protein
VARVVEAASVGSELGSVEGVGSVELVGSAEGAGSEALGSAVGVGSDVGSDGGSEGSRSSAAAWKVSGLATRSTDTAVATSG